MIAVLAAGILLAGCAEKKKEETKEESDDTMRVQVDTVKTDQFTMDYCKFGNGEKILVVLPGLSVQSVMPSAEAIANAYKLLTDDYTIYVFDRRKDVPAQYAVADMARDTAAAVRELGIEKADFFGASQGGMIALDIAINDPDLVHKLILGSSTACVGDEQYKVIKDWIDLAEAGDALALYLAFGEAVYPQEVFESARGMLTEAAGTVTKEELDHFVIIAEGLKDFNVLDKLDKITCPVLILGSKDDKVLGAEASKQMADGLKNSSHCELYLYENYGHACYDTAPDYTERIKKFLDAEE